LLTIRWASIAIALVSVVTILTSVDLSIATASPRELIMADPVLAIGVHAGLRALAVHLFAFALPRAASVVDRARIAVVAGQGVHLVGASPHVCARVGRAGVVVVADVVDLRAGAHPSDALIVVGAQLGVVARI